MPIKFTSIRLPIELRDMLKSRAGKRSLWYVIADLLEQRVGQPTKQKKVAKPKRSEPEAVQDTPCYQYAGECGKKVPHACTLGLRG